MKHIWQIRDESSRNLLFAAVDSTGLKELMESGDAGLYDEIYYPGSYAGQQILSLTAELGHLKDALTELANAAEDFAGSEPDMPSHKATEQIFDRALEQARALANHV